MMYRERMYKERMFQERYSRKTPTSRAEFIAGFVDDMSKVPVERFFVLLVQSCRDRDISVYTVLWFASQFIDLFNLNMRLFKFFNLKRNHVAIIYTTMRCSIGGMIILFTFRTILIHHC